MFGPVYQVVVGDWKMPRLENWLIGKGC